MRTTRVQTSDADEARARVADLFCEHRLEPAGRVVDVELSAYGAGGAGVVHLDYGVRVDIDPVTIDDFYLVQVPRGGSASVGPPSSPPRVPPRSSRPGSRCG